MPAGRPPRTPTITQISQAREYAKTGAKEEWIVAALEIPRATYQNNKHHKRWKEFRDAITQGRGMGNVIVAGENYLAARSKTDPTRAAARGLHFKLSGGIVEKVEVTGKDGKPIETKDTGPKGPAMTPAQAKAILAEIAKDREK